MKAKSVYKGLQIPKRLDYVERLVSLANLADSEPAQRLRAAIEADEKVQRDGETNSEQIDTNFERLLASSLLFEKAHAILKVRVEGDVISLTGPIAAKGQPPRELPITEGEAVLRYATIAAELLRSIADAVEASTYKPSMPNPRLGRPLGTFPRPSAGPFGLELSSNGRLYVQSDLTHHIFLPALEDLEPWRLRVCEANKCTRLYLRKRGDQKGCSPSCGDTINMSNARAGKGKRGKRSARFRTVRVKATKLRRGI